MNLKVLSLFSGIGAFEKALKRKGIPYELVNYCEIDKYASKAYSLVHNVPEDKNLGDITKVDEKSLQDFDLMTWGFPCCDISVAGKQQGIIKGETRSGLYYEGLRILKEKKPKYSIIENVKALISKKFRKEFKQILSDLTSLGYTTYWKVLNAKNYGIPQNRERVFIISVKTDIGQVFEFPEGFDNGVQLKDLLEDEVDSKYFLNESIATRLIREAGRDTDIIPKSMTTAKEVLPCITPDRVNKRQNGRRFKENGEPMFTITAQDRHGVLIKIGCIGTDSQANRVYAAEGLACTQSSLGGGLGAKTGLYLTNYRIRKLTPKESFRLMGFDDNDYQILKDNKISDTQLYKMAGNSIVVNVLEHIFQKLLSDYQIKEIEENKKYAP